MSICNGQQLEYILVNGSTHRFWYDPHFIWEVMQPPTLDPGLYIYILSRGRITGSASQYPSCLAISRDVSHCHVTLSINVFALLLSDDIAGSVRMIWLSPSEEERRHQTRSVRVKSSRVSFNSPQSSLYLAGLRLQGKRHQFAKLCRRSPVWTLCEANQPFIMVVNRRRSLTWKENVSIIFSNDPQPPRRRVLIAQHTYQMKDCKNVRMVDPVIIYHKPSPVMVNHLDLIKD